MSTRSLKILAGSIWLIVGIGLASVGFRFVFGLHEGGEAGSVAGIAASLLLGAGIGILKGRYVLSRTARRNRRRIEALKEPRFWKVFTRNFYVLILGMMLLGRGLRALAARDLLGGYTGVGGIYIGIGLALAVASYAYIQKPPAPMPTRSDVRPPACPTKLGVLLVNLGSPAAPTTSAVRRFLRQFLSDPRVIEVNRVLWMFVLNVIILPFRSSKSAALYQRVWTEDGSPLLLYSRQLESSVQAGLGEQTPVALGMRYGDPSLHSALEKLRAEGCDRVRVLPLFPQYSNTTTGSVQSAVFDVVSSWRNQPSLDFVPAFYDDPGYIEALAACCDEVSAGDFTVFSFHGLPEEYVKKGDLYLEHCTRTAWLLAERLGLKRDQWELIFQSRFGDEPWLQPYADEFVPALAARYKRVRVVAPAFTADCLETLDELGVELRDDFLEAGGEELILVPALNDHPAWIAAVVGLLKEERA